MCLRKFLLGGVLLTLLLLLFCSADVAPTDQSLSLLSLTIREELQLLKQESMIMSVELKNTIDLLEEQSQNLELSESERIKSQTELIESYTSLKNMTKKYNASITTTLRYEEIIRQQNKVIIWLALYAIICLVINIVQTIRWAYKPIKSWKELVLIWL